MAKLDIYLYLLATVLFILGIKGLCKVKSARTGNMLAAVGMLVAIIAASSIETGFCAAVPMIRALIAMR